LFCFFHATATTATYTLSLHDALPICRRGRQVEGEGASPARFALELQFPAQEVGEFPADRQAEAGSAVLAHRAAVDLLERLEDEAALVLGNTDAGVLHGEGHDLPGLAQVRPLHFADLGQSDPQFHASLL